MIPKSHTTRRTPKRFVLDKQSNRNCQFAFDCVLFRNMKAISLFHSNWSEKSLTWWHIWHKWSLRRPQIHFKSNLTSYKTENHSLTYMNRLLLLALPHHPWVCGWLSENFSPTISYFAYATFFYVCKRSDKIIHLNSVQNKLVARGFWILLQMIHVFSRNRHRIRSWDEKKIQNSMSIWNVSQENIMIPSVNFLILIFNIRIWWEYECENTKRIW